VIIKNARKVKSAIDLQQNLANGKAIWSLRIFAVSLTSINGSGKLRLPMRAIELAKKLYQALSKDDIVSLSCPDTLLICDKVMCNKDKEFVDNDCVKCWQQEVNQARIDWLMKANDMCKIIGC
jgi:hypothetical protein